MYYRESEQERLERTRMLLLNARQEGELSVFHQMEMKRPVKDPRYDARLLKQSKWAYEEQAQDLDHVAGLDNIKWRKGYGEDVDDNQPAGAQ